MMTVVGWCSPMSVSAAPLNCATDLDGNGIVGPPDLSIFMDDWGPCPPDAECPSDLDGDGQVHGSDLALLLHAWGQNMCLGIGGSEMQLGLYQCFDLESGAVMDMGLPDCISEQIDMHLAYNADDPQNHLRVVGDQAQGMKRLEGRPYVSVHCGMDADHNGMPDIAELDPPNHPNVDQPLGDNDTMFIKTLDNNSKERYYKVRATPIELPDGSLEATISFSELCPPAMPASED